MQINEEALTVAHVAVEDLLVDMRDSHMFTLAANGLVVNNKDGSLSDIKRLGTRQGLQLGVETYLKNVKLYVVMVHDRHLDPEARIYTSADEAITVARGLAHDMGLVDSGDEDFNDDGLAQAGWLYYANHPRESDIVWVVEKGINES
jgi:hypothetical protein